MTTSPKRATAGRPAGSKPWILVALSTEMFDVVIPLQVIRIVLGPRRSTLAPMSSRMARGNSHHRSAERCGE